MNANQTNKAIYFNMNVTKGIKITVFQPVLTENILICCDASLRFIKMAYYYSAIYIYIYTRRVNNSYRLRETKISLNTRPTCVVG